MIFHIFFGRYDLVFENLYENNLGKISAMVFSTVTAMITSPLIFSLIQYQEDNHYRILIGHLITSNLQTLLHWNMSVQVLHFRKLLKNFPILYQFIQIFFILLNNLINLI